MSSNVSLVLYKCFFNKCLLNLKKYIYFTYVVQAGRPQKIPPGQPIKTHPGSGGKGQVLRES